MLGSAPRVGPFSLLVAGLYSSVDEALGFQAKSLQLSDVAVDFQATIYCGYDNEGEII